jgi:hypothetical protein
VGAEVIGCVLNAFDASGSPYYYEPYYYSQYYSKHDEDGRRESAPADDIDLASDHSVERQGSV